MQLFDYIKSLTEKQQNDYAQRCGTTGGYLRAHIKHARKIPRKRLFKALASESCGAVSDKEVIDHFFGSSDVGSSATAA